jgi:hypothetical protein
MRGRPCRIVSIDLDESSVTSLPPPWSADAGALKPTVWIDAAGHLCRVEVHAEGRTQALDRWDFGVRVDELDWTRLPGWDADAGS